MNVLQFLSRVTILSIFFLICMVVAISAEPLMLTLQPGAEPGNYTLSGTGKDGAALDFTVYCLNQNLTTPFAPIAFNQLKGNASPLDPARLKQAGWIILQTNFTPTEKQTAIWQVFNGTVAPGTNTLAGLSQVGGQFVDLTGLDLLIPVEPNSAQPYLVVAAASSISISPAAPVPEPATLLLLGTGLASFGVGLKRRKAEKTQK